MRLAFLRRAGRLPGWSNRSGTRPVEVTVEAQAVGDRILVVGSFEIQFEDYDVTPPSAIPVLSVEDHGIIEFQVWFSRAAT